MRDLTWSEDLVAVVEKGVLLQAFCVLFVEEAVEGFVVFGGVFGLEGAEGEISVDFLGGVLVLFYEARRNGRASS